MFCTECGQELNPGDKYCPRCGTRVRNEAKVEVKTAKTKIETEKEIVKPSKTELYIRKILGILILVLVISAILLNLGALFIAPISLVIGIVIGIYLLRSKKYYLALDIFLVLLGFLLYAFPPISYPTTPLLGLKGFVLTADWTSEGIGPAPLNWLALFMINIIILGSAAFLLITDILSKIGAVTQSAKRELPTIILLVILGIFFGLPWLYPVGVGTGGCAGISGPGLGAIISIDPYKTSVSFNSENDIWVYQIALKNTMGRDGEIVGIMGKIASQKQQIAPPFGENIEVVGGEKTAEKIIVKPGMRETTILKIYSKDPLWIVTLIENGDKRWHISFWR